MEFVFTLVAVILLIVLPIAFLLFVIGGLVYAIRRAIMGDKTGGAVLSSPGAPEEPAGTTDPAATGMSPTSGRKDA